MALDVLVETTPPTAAAESALPAAPRTVIEPARRFEWVNVRELWRYRELLLFLVWRDLKVRYKQTALGAAWAVLQPALMMAVFTVFLGRLAGADAGGVPRPLFYLTGLLPWFFFSQALSAAAGSVLGSERLITKIYFPRLAVPFAAVAAAAVDFAIACGLLAVVMLWYGVAPGLSLLLAPVWCLAIGLLAAGVGTGLAALNVAYRDFRYVVPFLVQVGMFATPAIYMRPTGGEGEAFRWAVLLNPMNALVEAFREGVVGGPPPWAEVAVAAAIAVIAFLAGCLYFRKVEDRFADII